MSREAEVQILLDDAEARDHEADQRDSAAVERDEATALESFLDPDSDFDAVLLTRRAAASDRYASKGDRLSAADDRTNLSSDHESFPDSGDR